MASIVELYLEERGGSPYEYNRNLEDGQRLGQAFFNALSGVDQERLRGTIRDPFYKLSERKLEEAIEWLLESE